jgi:hypothetical protein
MDSWVWVEPVPTEFCSSILGTVESLEAKVLSTFCAVAPRMKACAGKAAQAEVRFAQTVTQRSRARLNCVALAALSAGSLVGARRIYRPSRRRGNHRKDEWQRAELQRWQPDPKSRGRFRCLGRRGRYWLAFIWPASRIVSALWITNRLRRRCAPGLKNWSRRLSMLTLRSTCYRLLRRTLMNWNAPGFSTGRSIIADAMLPLIEEQVARAEVAVAKYGPTIRMIAG